MVNTEREDANSARNRLLRGHQKQSDQLQKKTISIDGDDELWNTSRDDNTERQGILLDDMHKQLEESCEFLKDDK